ncbi:hypothetical protein LI82_06480 [Methanococcoides methylutens]|uniref:Uncharacterized protein n=1 Tax=Methanococcoides methylutens TaxID=2226 RepID=A0A099T409_METMT|nr:hypothetical protein [Methanococcoides methylutens]KGK98928.1 hypothetical protein LI82_06480 [Methanococcoides methylutens]
MEAEISYAIDLPQVVNSMNAPVFSWEHGVVNFTDNEIWFPTETSWKVIPLRSVENVGIDISPAVINNIRKESGYLDELMVNYKKSSLFGSSHIRHSMILAGNPQDLAQIKDHLIEKVGLRVNTSFEGLKEEEIKLLNLLATGTKDINRYLPLISDDRNILQRAFETLKRRDLVDESARITQQGQYYLEKKKGTSDPSIEKPVHFELEPKIETQTASNGLKPKDTMVQFTKKYEYSFTSGSVFLEDLWRYIMVPEIKDIGLKVSNINKPYIHIQTRSGTSIDIECENSQAILALERIFNEKENIQIRLLACLYLNIREDYNIANTLYFEPKYLNSQLNELIANRLIETDKTLSNNGFENIRHSLNFERSVSLEHFKRTLQ